MPKLTLRDFDYCWIDYLTKEGVRMIYDYSMKKNDPRGEWILDLKLVGINPYTRLEGKTIEDRTILHEGLHAFVDLVLELPHEKEEIEKKVEEAEAYHYRRNKMYADYIRRCWVITPQPIPRKFSFLNTAIVVQKF